MRSWSGSWNGEGVSGMRDQVSGSDDQGPSLFAAGPGSAGPPGSVETVRTRAARGRFPEEGRRNPDGEGALAGDAVNKEWPWSDDEIIRSVRLSIYPAPASQCPPTARGRSVKTRAVMQRVRCRVSGPAPHRRVLRKRRFRSPGVMRVSLCSSHRRPVHGRDFGAWTDSGT